MKNEKERIEDKFLKILKEYNKDRCDTIKTYFDFLYKKESFINDEGRE